MPRRIVFPEKQRALLEEFELPRLSAGELRVRIVCSQMSTGTENIQYNGLFETGSHWADFVKYPFNPGYTSVAVVEEVGAAAAGFDVGDRVMMRTHHASEAIVNADIAFKVPKGVPDELVPWGKLAQIAFTAARRTHYEFGDKVLIIGAGPIGQMAARWAAAAGCLIVAVADPLESRLELALRGGATHVIGLPIDQAHDEVLKACGGTLPDVVIDVTGAAAVLPIALNLVRNLGKVVILGDTGSPTEQHLTRDVVTRSLNILGVHHTQGLYEQGAIYELYFSLLARGRFNMDGMNTHTFLASECADAYALANTDRKGTMGIIFDWRHEK